MMKTKNGETVADLGGSIKKILKFNLRSKKWS